MIVELWRHGPTEGTAAHRYEGAGTDCPLDIAATRSALSLSPRARLAPQRVFASDMRRCIETVRLIYPDAPLVLRRNLREMHFGAFEGRGFADMEHDGAYRRWVDSGCEGPCPGGEDKAGFTRRVVAEVLSILEEEAARGSACVAIVAHGGCARAVLSELARPRIPYFSVEVPPAGRWLLEWDEDRFLVLAAPGEEAPCTWL